MLLYEILPEKARLIGMTYFKLRHTVLTSVKRVKDNYLLIFDGFSDRNGG
jgi:hypothetical protein